MITLDLPPATSEVLRSYMQLDFYGKQVQTPYYRNVRRVRAELRSLVGKGTPDEIVEETTIYAKLRGFDIRIATSDQIKQFMITQGLGIDCSGLVAHLLSSLTSELFGRRLTSFISYSNSSLLRKLIFRVRPIENISAELLTGVANSVPIRLIDIRPADLIRLKGLKDGDHVAIITHVEYDSKMRPTKITYAHAAEQFIRENGVKTGDIMVTNPDRDLEDQNWLEVNDTGKKVTLEQLLKDHHDNGLRRPKFLLNFEWKPS